MYEQQRGNNGDQQGGGNNTHHIFLFWCSTAKLAIVFDSRKPTTISYLFLQIFETTKGKNLPQHPQIMHADA